MIPVAASTFGDIRAGAASCAAIRTYERDSQNYPSGGARLPFRRRNVGAPARPESRASHRARKPRSPRAAKVGAARSSRSRAPSLTGTGAEGRLPLRPKVMDHEVAHKSQPH